jgi:hypothetical protein
MMGKRFKELAEQAGLYDFVFEAMGVDEELTNFAELIVLECAVIVGSMEEPHQDIAKLIKQHFGLEN